MMINPFLPVSTKKIATTLVAIALVVIALIAYIFGLQERSTFAAAPPGVPATMATTSQITIGPGSGGDGVNEIIFATSSCTARVISTVASPIMLSFTLSNGSTTLPSGTSGLLQGASTTIAYDSELYGCGAVVAYGFSTSTISISEAR